MTDEAVVPANVVSPPELPPERVHRPSAHKIGVAGVAGSFTIIVIWIASMYGLEVPNSVAQAFTMLVATGVSLLVPDDMEAP